jgi:hypothetical protein
MIGRRAHYPLTKAPRWKPKTRKLTEEDRKRQLSFDFSLPREKVNNDAKNKAKSRRARPQAQS